MMKEEKKKKTTKKTITKKETTKRPAKKKEENIEIVSKSVEFSLIEVIVIVLITGIVVSIASGLIVYKNYGKLNIEGVTPKSELSEFVDNYNKIVNKYVEEVDKEALIDAAIKGMYNYLEDEYSMYLDIDDTNTLEEQLTGEYTGIGVEITTVSEEGKDPYVKVTKVFTDSPAEKAGLKVGDIISKVDGEPMHDASEVSNTVKGGNKESYDISYIRNGKESTLKLTRERVLINSVFSKVYDNVGYIQIETFSSTTVNQVLKEMEKFDNKVTSLVIDVRNNSGGYLNTADELSDLFIEKGKVIYQIKDRDGKITKHLAKNGVKRKFKKIVVLINDGSASASEILALALRDSAGATVVGTKSYGKGTVQETSILNSGAMVKYTTSYWLGPKGETINLLGIEPDILVENADEQLNKAIEAAK